MSRRVSAEHHHGAQWVELRDPEGGASRALSRDLGRAACATAHTSAPRAQVRLAVHPAAAHGALWDLVTNRPCPPSTD